MTDWRGVASAAGFHFPKTDLDRIVPVLELLESGFAPLANLLDYTAEPAIVLSDAAVTGAVAEE